MKIKSLILLPFFALLIFMSCQDEVIEITEIDEEQVFEANSQVANLMARVSTKDGSKDNIIDGSRELSVNLPVKVFANSEEITINSTKDYSKIETNFDANEDDDDTLEIEFPITVTSRDYSKTVVNSRTELNALRGDFPNEGEDDDIECIDFKYPISFSVYNANFQVAEVVTVNSDKELFLFIKNLEPGVLVRLNFPVTMEYADGSTVEVFNYIQLVKVIIEAIHLCDEDDDNDYNDDDFTKKRLDELLQSCPWIVKDIHRNDNNLNNNYQDYAMFFNEDGKVQVRTNTGNIHTGSWETEITTDRGAKITLKFDTLVDFTLQWFVYEIEEGKIKLFTEGGNRIILKKDCDVLTSDCSEEHIKDFLKTCNWNVVAFDGSDNLIEYELSFRDDQKLYVTLGTDQVLAKWSVSLSSTGRTEITLSEVAASGIQAINGSWNVLECGEDRIKFIDANNQTMVIEKNNCYGEEEFKNVITACSLEVSELLFNGTNLANEFNDYLFTFYENGMLVVQTNGDKINYGSWDATTGINGNAVVLINMLELSNNINGYYELESFDSKFIKLTTIEDKVLKFKKRCENTNPDNDVEQIKTWLRNDLWQITYFVQDGIDQTDDFTDVKFNFQENNNTVVIDYSVATPSEQNLQYEVLRDNSNQLRFIINYLGLFPYYEIDNDWYITEVGENKIELHNINEPNDTQNVLVIEKIQ